jgi:hypothetical protein
MFPVTIVYPGPPVPCRLTWIQTAYSKSESDCPIIHVLARQLAANAIIWSFGSRQKSNLNWFYLPIKSGKIRHYWNKVSYENTISLTIYDLLKLQWHGTLLLDCIFHVIQWYLYYYPFQLTFPSVVGWGTMLQGRAIAQAVSRRLPTAAARVQTRT